MNIIIKGLTIALLSLAALAAINSAQAALYCQGDAECLSKGLSLVKKARKAGCDATAFARGLGAPKASHDAFNASEVASIEICIEKAKYQAGLAKKATKRIERIQKALETPQK